jgi:hypothetical protein
MMPESVLTERFSQIVALAEIYPEILNSQTIAKYNFLKSALSIQSILETEIKESFDPELSRALDCLESLIEYLNRKSFIDG